jgi:hypothetical protein
LKIGDNTYEKYYRNEKDVIFLFSSSPAFSSCVCFFNELCGFR